MNHSPRTPSDPTGALCDMGLLILRLGCRLLHTEWGIVLVFCTFTLLSMNWLMHGTVL